MKPSQSVFSQARHPINPDGRTARFDLLHEAALEEFPTAFNIFRDEFMWQVANEYYALNKFYLNDEVLITHELPFDLPILPWHFDRIQSLKFWLNLTDTTVKNGDFECCPGTHSEGRYRAGFYLSQGYGVEDIPNDIDEVMIINPVTINLNAGDLLIFDSDGFHRGGVVQPGEERRVLRGHTHPKGLRRYGDRPLTAGWWLKSFLNLNKWTGNASKRILGEKNQDKTINRKNKME